MRTTFFDCVHDMLRNITLSADADLIERARARARQEGTTLNEQLRQWLTDYAATDPAVARLHDTLKRLRHLRSERGYSREEMTQR